MPTFTSRRRSALLLGFAVACSFIASRALAGAGSGDAILFGPNPAVAGQHEEWTVQYHATESFAAGSVVEIQIPPGWSLPQNSDSIAPGYFQSLGDPGIDSVDASGPTIRVHLSPSFAADSYFWIYYGIGGGNAYAHAQTAAQDSVFFRVRSDPQATGSLLEIASPPFLSVVAAPPDHIALAPDTLRLEAGTPDSVTVSILDPFGNRTALLAPETLTLWTDRTSGTFRDLSGSTTLFEITAPAGADSARFTFTDTRTTSTEGRFRAIDANGVSPFLGTAGASVFTAPGVPAAIALAASPDTAIANGADSVLVSGSVADAYGNPVALGERFTFSGSASPALTPVTDEDPSTPGAQLLADAAGAVRGYLRVGTTAGVGGATVTALRAGTGSPATATAAIRLLADIPSGTIALSAPVDSIAADSVATLSIGASGLHDLGGNTVRDGERYTVTSTLGAILTADADPATPGKQVEALGGAISFTLLGGDVLGTAVVDVKAVRDTVSAGTLSLRLVPGAVDGSRSLVDAASPAPVGPAGSVIHVDLFDRRNHPIPGVPAASVSVTMTGLAATVSAIGAATDAGGRIDFRATTTAADTGIVHVTAGGVPLASQPAVVFTPGPLNHYTIAGPPGPLTAGTGVSLTVSAFDGFGNAMPAESGEILTPTVTAGAATVPSSVTLAGGTAVLGVTPTQAAPLTIQVSDGARPAVTYGPVGVNPSGAATLTLAPDSLTLTPTQVKLTTVTVRDAQGNPVQGQAVTFYLGGPLVSGALESSGGTSGGPGSQSGISNSSGKVTVRYHAPVTAPAVDSILVSGGGAAPVGIRAITSPGTTASLRVLPASHAWTAGVPESVRVQAEDAFGNRVTAEGAVVTMRPSGAVVWNPASGAMTAGQLAVTGADTLAETIAIDADRAGGGTGSGGTATVGPAAPSGAIAIAATRDTLTADGHSASDVTLGPVHDRFGNLVGTGALIGVSAQTGTLVASDASALFPGLDLATGADSRASVVLIAAATTGPDTLRAVARAGSASGAHGFLYQAPPSLVYVAGTLSPGAVTPGGTVSFTLQARDTGPGSIQLGVGSSVSFGSGVSAFSAPLASAVGIGSGVTATLTFAATLVPASLAPGSYAPSFRATGTDPTGASFDFFPSLAGAQVSVLGVGVTAVSAAPDPVPLGYGALSLVFDVTNASGTPGDLTGATVGYSAGAFLTGPPSPPLGTTIPAGATTRFTFPAQVPASGLAPGTTVGATLQATLTYGGNAVLGASATPLSFRVVSAAQIAAVGGSGSPARILRGRTAAPSVRVTNSGAAAVTLSRGTTRLLLDRGGSTVAFTLAAATAVGAADQATLVFDSLAVPGPTAKGRYRARLFLDGVESGQSFVDSVAFAPDSLEIVDPALLSVVPGSLAPATVSAGQTRPVSLTLRNDGDVPFAIDPSTVLRFGAPVSATLTTTTSPTVGASQSVSLTFGGGALGSPASPGDAAAWLDLLGFEDGVARAQTLSADSLHARAPAVIQYVAKSTVPSQTRPAQTIDVALDVRNTGGSPFTLNPVTSRISLSDGTDLATGLGSGAPVVVAPAARVTLQFPALSIPAAMASQPYRVDLALQGVEWGLAGAAAVTSPDSEVVVLDPLAGLEARAVDTAPPVQVSLGSPPVRVWGLSLTPLAAVGSAASYSLRSVAITVLTDGSAAPAPAGAVTSIALRDGAGTLLAQAAPSASNPVVLTLAPPISLGNAAESLYVEAAFRPGTTARSVAFRLAQAGDVSAVDVTTSSPVPILGGGGLPFVALTSSEITFFDRPHGYPNPFHAGREAILLSYVLGQDAAVKVTIYTLFGDRVREIAADAGARGGTVGLNEIPWDGRNGKGELVRPGVYVAAIDGPGVSEKIKVGVLR